MGPVTGALDGAGHGRAGCQGLGHRLLVRLLPWWACPAGGGPLLSLLQAAAGLLQAAAAACGASCIPHACRSPACRGCRPPHVAPIFLCGRAASKALAITEPSYSFDTVKANWGSRPHDVAAVAAWRLGMDDAALKHGEAMAALRPGDERAASDLGFYRRKARESAAALLAKLEALDPALAAPTRSSAGGAAR